MKKYICIDIGGTSIKYGAIQSQGEFLDTGEMPTEARQYGGSGILDKAGKIIKEYIREYSPQGICISTAGMVDCDAGKIIYSAPLIPNYTGTEIKKTLEETFCLPCEVENDVNCAGLAEYYAGAARGSMTSVCLTIGTGIGGAAVIDGKIFRGFSGSACEVGYMHLPGGQFQDLGAGSILVGKVAKSRGLCPSAINGITIFEDAKRGDAACIQAIHEMVDILGMGIANICYVLNPEVVVLGGGIMAQKEFLKEKIQTSLKKYLIPSVLDYTRLAFAENQNRAGMLGAYYNFIQRHPDNG